MLRMMHIGETAARQPMLVQRVFMRLADRRPQQAGILRLPPRHVLIGPGPHETLHHVQHMRPRLVRRGRARHRARLQIDIRTGRLQIRLHAVFAQQRHEVLQIARAHAVRNEPAAVLGMHDARRGVRRLQRMPAGQPPQRHPPHHPVHDVQFGVFRHRLMDRHRNVLAEPGAVAVDQRGDDAGGELLARDVIRVPDLRRDRRRVVFQVRIGIVTAIHHDPAQREMDQIGAVEILPRPVVAERRHPRDDQFGKALFQRRAIQTQRGIQRAATGIQQHVGAFQQAQQPFLTRLLPQVQHDGFFVAVVVPEEQRTIRARLDRPETVRCAVSRCPPAVRS